MKRSGEDFWRELRTNRFFDELKYILEKITYEARKQRVRLVLVLNPRSTQAKRAEEEILKPLYQYIFEDKKIENITLFRYEVKLTHVDDNALKLAECLKDGDVVLAIGGDGTASIGVNGVILSDKKVKFYTIPYGNFNDIARTLKKARGQKIYAMEALVDDEHFRYALCYFTAGMLAESTKIFNEKKNRERLRKKRKNLIFSLWILFVWFMKNRRRQWFSGFRQELMLRNGAKKEVILRGNMSDLIALNGATMARILRGGEYYGSKSFLVRNANLAGFFRVCGFMLRGILGHVAGDEVKNVVYYFEQPTNFEIQAEGELKEFEGILKIEFRKSEKTLQIL